MPMVSASLARRSSSSFRPSVSFGLACFRRKSLPSLIRNGFAISLAFSMRCFVFMIYSSIFAFPVHRTLSANWVLRITADGTVSSACVFDRLMSSVSFRVAPLHRRDPQESSWIPGGPGGCGPVPHPHEYLASSLLPEAPLLSIQREEYGGHSRVTGSP